MKKCRIHLLDVIIFAVLLVGICLLLYPSVSNWVNQRTQSRAVAGYISTVESLDKTDYAAILAEAESYNKQLATDPDRYLETEDRLERYEQVLDVNQSGIMGYVEIPKIKVKLPIYHGTDDATLQVGVGHIYGTSVPVGGPGTHSAISGHRGLTSATLFTNLDDLEVGDRFYVTVLGEVMAYEVDRIDVVLPEELDLLHIEEGKDYVTLVTCTPYSVNSHRLLVRGERTEYVPEEKAGDASVVTEEDRTNLFLGIIVVVVVLFIIWALMPAKKKDTRE